MSSLTPRINEIEKKSVVNLLINGAFEFDQRNGGTSSVANNDYIVDRFYKSLGDSSQRVVVSEPSHKYAYELVASAGHAFEQRIEARFLEGMVGKTLNFQCKIKLVSGTTFTPKIAVLHADAEDDWTTSTQDIIADLDGSLSGSFSIFKYSFVVTQDMVSNGMSIKLGDLVDLTAHTVQYAQAMLYLDNGQDIEVDFQRAGRNYVEELQLCQRYFEKSYNLDSPLGTTTTGGASQQRAFVTGGGGPTLVFEYKVRKRALPIVTTYSTNNGAADRLYNSTQGNIVTVYLNIGETKFNARPSSSPTTSNSTYQAHFGADAEL